MLYTPSFGEPVSMATQPELTVALPMVVAGEAPQRRWNCDAARRR